MLSHTFEKPISFQRLAVLALRPHKGKKNRTYAANRIAVRHLFKTFWGLPSTQLKGELFSDVHVPKMRRDGTVRNLNNERKLFIQIAYRAYNLGHSPRPPTKIPKPDIEKEVGRELNQDEINRLFKACRDSTLLLQMQTALETGLRENEMLALHFSFFDFQKRLIRLPTWAAKGKKKNRVIPISEALCVKYLELKRISLFDTCFVEEYIPGKRRFVSQRGWAKVRAVAGVGCRWHDWRHTCATQRVRMGVPEKIISKCLGMSLGVLNRIYTHLSEEDLRPFAPTAGYYRLEAS